MIRETARTFLLGDWMAGLWAFVAFLLSIFSFIGCDYVRLNFDAVNDSAIFFQQSSWFGLGLLHHQNFDENKNSVIWEHDPTCSSYDDLAISMFRSTNLGNSFKLTAIATAMNAILIMLIYAVMYSKRQCYAGRIFNCSVSLASTILQISAYVNIFSASNGGICDPSTYWNNWYTKFSPFRYPSTAYIKFFSECTAGATSKVAIASISCQILTLLWMCAKLFIMLKAQEATEEEEEGIVKNEFADDIPQYISKDVEEQGEIRSDADDAIKSKSLIDSPQNVATNERGNIAEVDDSEIQNHEETAVVDDQGEEESSTSQLPPSTMNEEILIEEGSIDSLKDNGGISELDEIETTAAETVPLTIGTNEEDASNITGAMSQTNQSIASGNVDNNSLTIEAGSRLLNELSFLGI